MRPSAIVEAVFGESWQAANLSASAQAVLREEVGRLDRGMAALLPFIASKKCVWVLAAPTFAELRRERDLVRPWLVPTFFQPVPGREFIAPEEASGQAAELLRLSPEGFHRWEGFRAQLEPALDRLALLRRVQGRQPAGTRASVPSLLEIRQAFRLALAARRPDLAAEQLRLIEQHDLDGARNCRLMRLQLRHAVGDFVAIATDPELDLLVQLPLTRLARAAVIEALHAVHCAPHEPQAPDEAEARFNAEVHPRLGGMLVSARPEDGAAVAICLAYDARRRHDSTALRQLSAHLPDWLRSAATPAADEQVPEPSEARLRDALARHDLRAVQEEGGRLVATREHLTPAIVKVIEASLAVLPNAALADALAAAVTDETTYTRPIQTWAEALIRLREGNRAAVEQFVAIDGDDRPAPSSMSLGECEALLEFVQECQTTPDAELRHWVRRTVLPALVEDFIRRQDDVQPSLVGVYGVLMDLWCEANAESGGAEHAAVLLRMAELVLRASPTGIALAADALRAWWEARPVAVRLPFVEEAIELLLDHSGVDNAGALGLWYAALDLVRLQGDAGGLISIGFWRALGRRAGIDHASLQELLPPTQAEGDAEDALAVLNDRRVAIVTLRLKAAEAARDEILRRVPRARVEVVDETVPGVGTSRALAADVVLFVWASTTHAVYRAFDGARERLQYVSGGGAASIVRSLERWCRRSERLALV